MGYQAPRQSSILASSLRLLTKMASHLSQTGYLQPLLHDLVYRAQHAPGTFQATRLVSGLLVELLYHDRRIHLQLSRSSEFPRMDEYWEVLDYWPLKIGRQLPKVAAHSGRKYLTSIWPAPQLPDF